MDNILFHQVLEEENCLFVIFRKEENCLFVKNNIE